MVRYSKVMRLLWWVVLIGCGKSAPTASSTGSATPGSATAVATAAAGSAATGAGSSAPAGLPSLGEPPAGVDRAKAVACDAGDARACVEAARSYMPGFGDRAKLSKEDADAREQVTVRYAMRACELKDGEGCAIAATFGPYKDLDATRKRACDLGYAAACGAIGTQALAAAKRGSPAALQGAALVEKACLANASDPTGLGAKPGELCFALYEYYRDGKPKDQATAKKFLDLACSQGHRADCPCKTDKDCEGSPDGYDYMCSDGTCSGMAPG